MRKLAILAFGLLLAAGSPAAASPAAATKKPSPPHHSSSRSGRSPAIDPIFHAYDRKDSPGCALAVVERGKVVEARGYGMASLEHDRPIDADTVFDIGSAAKQFTAASVVLLSLDGKLALDDDVRRYVPELPASGIPFTIRQLLHHTSGLRDYTGLLPLAGARTPDLTTEREALEMLARQKGVEFPPGTRYQYCNSGFFLLSIVVERASGKTLRDFAKERIFGPLGMTSTRFVRDSREVIPRRATGYARARKEPAGGPEFHVAMSDWEQNGDGGLQTSARDLARWDHNFEQPAVGGAKMIEELTRTGTLSDGKPIDYALGLRVDRDEGILRVRHGGSWAGFKAEFLRYPERRLSVIVTCNVRDAVPSRLARAVAALYLPELARKPAAAGEASPAPPPSAAATSASDSAALAGLYWSERRLEIRRVSFENGKAFYQESAGGKPQPLVALGNGRFRLQSSAVEVAFENDPGAPASGEKHIVERDPEEGTSEWRRVKPAAPADPARFAGTYYCDELDAVFRTRNLVLESDPLR